MNDSNHDPEGGWRLATRLVRGGTERTPFDETSEGLFLTSGYVYESAEEAEQAFKGEKTRFIYSRYANPTLAMFEKRMALLEGAAVCRATASGMAAVFAAMMALLKAGDRVVASRALFGSCHYIVTTLLPRYGIETELVDGTDLASWRAALEKPTQCVFLETPSNPTLEVIDLPAVAHLAHKSDARVVVDNVFATPILQKPLQLGADVVVYSTTKHIDGQGRTLGGAILTNHTDWVDEHLTPFLRHTGPAMSPFNAWVLLKGLETLNLRVRRQCKTARTLADFLADAPGIERVLYPGRPNHPQHAVAKSQMNKGGTVLSFEVSGGKNAAFRLLNALETIDISNNLGDAKSLITHPATTTHERVGPEERARMGIGDGLVRLSVGLEDPDDLIDDLKRGLEAAGRE